MSLCSSHHLCKAGASSCFNVKLNIYIQACVMMGWFGDLFNSSVSLFVLRVSKCCVP